ncbi:hypothetical protein GCM10025771_34250 [Niveibacterium umoris]|uniref:Uncharacterized protein n=1 Tax=Niveibacterium umoris TaxID=1193620 RepID=A0A840BCY8_9RHOO|nr:hypothetical protein [Niveibacterium umoris]MBB4011381.1 hypothetical protein [Niveibacterium umoris]
MSLPIALQIYLLAAVVSFAVAGLIHVLVRVLEATRSAGGDKNGGAQPGFATASAGGGVTPAQVAAIAAALSEVLGDARIVRIEPAEGRHNWVTGARSALHDSHHLARSPGRSANQ